MVPIDGTVDSKRVVEHRRATLERLKLLERVGDPSLTALTRLATFVTGGESAAVHVLDEHAQHRVAATNAPLGAHPSSDAMCRLVVDGAQRIVCADATGDPRFTYSSFTRGEDAVRFYASVPLRVTDDTVIGTLCAWDRSPRTLSDEQLARLDDLAEQTTTLIQLVRIATELGGAATHDPLTGATNRLLLDDRLALAFARRARSGGDVLVAVLDVDDFKRLNDTFGHELGDHVLVTIAERLRGATRDGDTVARLGGDEFAVVAEITPGGMSAGEFIARIEKSLDLPISHSGVEHRVTVSVGAAAAEPGDSVGSALARADQVMYTNKRAVPALAVPR